MINKKELALLKNLRGWTYPFYKEYFKDERKEFNSLLKKNIIYKFSDDPECYYVRFKKPVYENPEGMGGYSVKNKQKTKQTSALKFTSCITLLKVL